MVSSVFLSLASKMLNPLSCKNFRRLTSLHFSLDSKYLSYKELRQVGIIGINRPQKRNALDSSMVEDLKNLILEFENDADVFIGIIYGEGGNFCAGYDLEELANADEVPVNFLQNNFTENYPKKPLIAAVNGFAVGFGFDLALYCDMRIMDETAVFGCYGRRYGTSMSEAGIGRLQTAVGLSRAMDLILTGRSIRSEEALQCGLANRVAGCGTAIGQALNLAMDIMKFPEAGVLTDRAILYKHVFSKIRLKNSIIDHDAEKYKVQIFKESREGAKLFMNGAGRNGQLFSKYLWGNKFNE